MFIPETFSAMDEEARYDTHETVMYWITNMLQSDYLFTVICSVKAFCYGKWTSHPSHLNSNISNIFLSDPAGASQCPAPAWEP